MATTNYERVGRAMELLKDGLRPYVEREYKATYGETWRARAAQVLRQDRERQNDADDLHLDVQALLAMMWHQWNEVFAVQLGHAERSLVSELRQARNRWAHQESFSGDDTYRVLDSAQRLLVAVSAPQAQELEQMKQDLLRVRFEEQARREVRKTAVTSLEGQPKAGLRPWRQIITPHPDVAAGNYKNAEFSANLVQVSQNEGADEYRDLREFFSRTYLTEGLRALLTNALRRLSGNGGDPVVELQTNFGGGKTHSMIALYHLFGGRSPAELPGIDVIAREVGVERLPAARRAVLVGFALSPAGLQAKPDGTRPHTMWGELAWQLAGAEGYALVADADANGVSPGSQALCALFDRCGPCLILIDEWVTFVRQLYKDDRQVAGSFDANLTFAQALTEAARQSKGVLVVASIPSSDNEIGGEGGRAALDRLKNIFGRMESAWRPASAEEGFEIVRRRLFQPITDPTLYASRDAVVRAFAEMYRAEAREFPSASREGDYLRRMTAAYPIHPELFDRLYTDWSTIDKFQRTRGVLRLMAAVIHELWERQDGNLLIMPSSVPIDAPVVQSELTHYLEDTWVPVLEKDVDGPHSVPLNIDRTYQNLGRYSACRRVARTLYLGSAPTLRTSRRGLEESSIKLGCVQPGESVATFGDALRRYTDQATHVYVDGKRYWLSTQPSVARVAQDRAEQYSREEVWDEIVARLRRDRQRGDFAGLHVAPESSADVPDEMEARLVVLAPEYAHSGRSADSPARRFAQEIMESRGNSPRRYRNMLVFLAPDEKRLEELEQAVRQYRAWKSIVDEKEELNLDAFQSNQATTKTQQADLTVDSRIPEAYSWALAPTEPAQRAGDAGDGAARNPAWIDWEEQRLQGQGPLAVRAARKLKEMGLLVTALAATPLRLELDRYLWRERDHLPLKTLWEYFATYLYLPRLRDSTVLLDAVRAGVAQLTWSSETFAYAERWDEEQGRYLGLVSGQHAHVVFDNDAVIVKPAAALRQIEADHERQRAQEQDAAGTAAGGYVAGGAAAGSPCNDELEGYAPAVGGATVQTLAAPPKLRRFHGSVELDPLRLASGAGDVADHVVQHMAGLLQARVRVTLEIEVELPDGAPEHVVRTVSENCRTLKFTSQGFEEE